MLSYITLALSAITLPLTMFYFYKGVLTLKCNHMTDSEKKGLYVVLAIFSLLLSISAFNLTIRCMSLFDPIVSHYISRYRSFVSQAFALIVALYYGRLIKD